MENSTKALFIVAGVLISIILIAVSIKMLAPSEDATNKAKDVEEEMAQTTTNVRDDTISSLEDINNKSLTKIEDMNLKVENKHYQQYFPQNPKVLLQPNTTYMLTFDYKVNYADYALGCGIGYRKNVL